MSSVDAPEWLQCRNCGSRYELFGGIPDFRVGTEAWIDIEADRALAHRFQARMDTWSTEELIREIFRTRGPSEEWVNRRTRQVLEAPSRLMPEVQGWLAACTAPGQLFLDLGCGPGMLLAAASGDGCKGIGVDVSLVWLLAAQRVIRDQGGTALLAAAFAEALPLRDGTVSGVAALDVIEHVANQAAMLREIERVAAPGSHLALSTPNRFSLGPEAHIGVWGVGWLPRRFQRRYVKWRSGREYGLVLSMSAGGAARLLEQHTTFRFQLLVPEIAAHEIVRFSPRKARVARAYNSLVRSGCFYPLLLRIGPFFRVIGTKPRPALLPSAPPRPEFAGDVSTCIV